MRPIATVLAVLFAAVLAAPAALRAEQVSPRDIWPQATSAADAGDIDTAIKKTNDLTDVGKSYGIRTYPLYAMSAESFARAVGKQNPKAASWAVNAASVLDPKSPDIAFVEADRLADNGNWGGAVTSAFKGITRVFASYRARLLARCDLTIVICISIFLTTLVFAVALALRYGRSAAHDFREILGARFHGGSVTVLAFALLFLPLFIWLGPMWLMFYWLVLFFGYATVRERVVTVILCVLVAAVPILLDESAFRISAIESPVVTATIASAEQSYRPEVMRRLEDLVTLLPDDPNLHLLLGNMLLQDGNEPQAAIQYHRALELQDSAGAHVNLGNLHFLDNDFSAAITEYEKAEQLDSKLAIAFYNNSVASGETYKFDEQGQKIEQAKKIDRSLIERLLSSPPPQKIVTYHPPLPQAWKIAADIARKGQARSLFANYSWFEPSASAANPLTLAGALAIVLAFVVWSMRRRTGFAGSCIKCGRTFCRRCKSGRESATYCTQCIHIYLKRDGVALDTKRSKVEEVHDHQTGLVKRNRIFASILPGAGQLLEGRTISGVLALFIFLLFVCMAILVGRLAPALGPASTAKNLVRIGSILLAILSWIGFSIPVFRRRYSA